MNKLSRIRRAKNMHTRSGRFQDQATQDAFQKQVAVASPFRKGVDPIAEKNNASTPPGQPMVTVQVPNAVAVEDNYTITLDNATNVDGSNGGEDYFVLWDQGEYYKTDNAGAYHGPQAADNNAIYRGARDKNFYPNLREGLCGSTYVFSRMQLVVIGSQEKAIEQLQKDWKRFAYSAAGKSDGTEPLEIQNYIDPYQQLHNVRMIELTMGNWARVDRGIAWRIPVLRGVKLNVTLWQTLVKNGSMT